MKNNNPTSLILLGVLLGACTLGKVYERPKDIAPENFRISSVERKSIADIPWWSLFQDSVLVRLIDTSLTNNLDLAVAGSRIKQAEAQLGVVRANLFPRVNYGLEANTTASNLANTSAITGVVPISYQVDLWGQFRNLRDAAFYDYLPPRRPIAGLPSPWPPVSPMPIFYFAI